MFTNVLTYAIMLHKVRNLKNYNEVLNQIIEDIENHLTEEINYKQIAKIVGITDYALQRIFSFIVGDMTLAEYVRKRRLSCAMQELAKGEKVIDVALKYQYDSPISFTRAFKKMYNIAPSKVKQMTNSLKVFPKVTFDNTADSSQKLEYRIVPLEEQTFYGKSTKLIKTTDSKAVAELWRQVCKDGTLDYIKRTSTSFYYGASIYTNIEGMKTGQKEDKMHYYILGKEKRQDFSKVVIPKATWALFKVKSEKQKDILDMINQIFLQWLPNSEYEYVYPYYNIEIYYNNWCEYGIPVKKKQ